MSLAKYESADPNKFTHCIVQSSESDCSKKFNTLIRYQRESYSMYKFWQSYIETYNDGSIENHDVVNVKELLSEQPILHQQWQSTPLATLSAFSDHQTMECISLYLHDSEKGNIGGRYGAAAGAYMPASVADTLIEENQAFSNYDDILNSKMIFTVSSNDKSVVFSVNNIYYDVTNENQEMNDFSKKTNYYNEFFAKTSKSPIIVYDKTFFEDGNFVLAYDLCDNYGNANLFFKRVIGYDFHKNGISVSIYDSNGGELTDFESINRISDEFNEPLSSKSIVFLSITIILFSLIPICSIVNRKIIVSERRTILYLFALLPYFLVYLICQVASLFLNRTSAFVVTFNYIGSLIILFNGVVALITLLLLRKYYAKTSKKYC